MVRKMCILQKNAEMYSLCGNCTAPYQIVEEIDGIEFYTEVFNRNIRLLAYSGKKLEYIPPSEGVENEMNEIVYREGSVNMNGLYSPPHIDENTLRVAKYLLDN